ncbi:activated RNA polymerase ii transcriptional coactivator p15 [Anaeramoeba flamelloides]|uniref:Activated RNA polymerase ii transcriptional coactivator p15 n=1 Tax=Anaeramoeba flamelloides TaxID=1746091 RepID=A0ABQ8YCR6_9EUKA|nr:activated RNA polymerase ii transcriptional coactivator p15 [Anaeramoeba flamelloides]
MDHNLKVEIKKSLKRLLQIINFKSTSLNQLISILEGQLRVKKNTFLRYRSELEELFIECISELQSKQLNGKLKQEKSQKQKQKQKQKSLQQQPQRKKSQQQKQKHKQKSQEQSLVIKNTGKGKIEKMNKNKVVNYIKKKNRMSLKEFEFTQISLFKKDSHQPFLNKHLTINKHFHNRETAFEKVCIKDQNTIPNKKKVQVFQQQEETEKTKEKCKSISGFITDLGNNCFVTQNYFQNVCYLHIRKYFFQNGDWRPTKKGITFTKQQWKEFSCIIPQVHKIIQTKFN